MKKIVTIVVVATGLIVASTQTQAQTRSVISACGELIPAMPEVQEGRYSPDDYQSALGPEFRGHEKGVLLEQDSLLNSKDTAKYTKAQLELKRKNMGEILIKLQGWQQQASAVVPAETAGADRRLFRRKPLKRYRPSPRKMDMPMC